MHPQYQCDIDKLDNVQRRAAQFCKWDYCYTFGYPVLISTDFDDFTSAFTPKFLFRLRRYIKHSRQCLIGYSKTSNFVKNTPAACRLRVNPYLDVWISQ